MYASKEFQIHISAVLPADGLWYANSGMSADNAADVKSTISI